MPTEVARAVGMHAFSEFPPASTVRALSRGPDYLRRQMEGGGRGRMSAVERLAADKPKYVKSPQVACSTQEPAGRFSSASESSSESCSAESRQSAPRPHNENLDPNHPADSCRALRGPPIPRRSSSKRQMRPDSLLIYRQKSKSETVKGQSGEAPRGGLVRRLFHGPAKDKLLPGADLSKGVVIKEDGEGPGSRHSMAAPAAPAHLDSFSAGLLLPEVRRGGVHRSQSDISSRYSKAFAESDTFFKYCGLEPEVIEDMGKERFSAASDNVSFRVRSVSVATSDGGFSRHSGDEGLQEEELREQVHSTTSVIERNARIIKWLYSCKKAKQPREAVQ